MEQQKKCHGYLLLSILIAGGLFTRFLWLAHPAVVVWDEHHFSRYAAHYLDGRYFFDIHPPLGKLLIAAALRAAGAGPVAFDFEPDTPYPAEYPHVAARFFPALFGGLLPAVVYLFARSLRLSTRASFVAGALALLDNALLAESRLVFIDILVPFFGYAALAAFLAHQRFSPFQSRWWLLLTLSAFLAICAASVKWTGGGALLVIALLAFIEAVREKRWRVLGTRMLVLASISVMVYTLLFAVHFRLLPNSGSGDRFMSRSFAASLGGSAARQERQVRPATFLEKFWETNKKMFLLNAREWRDTTPLASSRFYEWPLGRRGIGFWSEPGETGRHIVYLGNPVSRLFGLAGVLGGTVFLVLRRKALRALLPAHREQRALLGSAAVLLSVYAVNWLPFAAILRPMFLYHYVSAFIASIVLGSLLALDLIPALGAKNALGFTIGNRYLVWMLLVLALGGFAILAPFSYGVKLPWLVPPL